MSQTFKYPIPLNILIEILEKICVKTDKYYFIDISSTLLVETDEKISKE